MPSIELSRYEAEAGDLPDVCMCCGEEATERKRRRFIAHPLWIYLLLPFIPIYFIVAAMFTEDIRCYTLFCPRHKNYWLVRNLLVWGSLVVVLALIVGGFVPVLSLINKSRESREKEFIEKIDAINRRANIDQLRVKNDKSTEEYIGESFCIGTVVLLMGWLISIPISQVTAIHPAKTSRSRLTLKRVSPAFVEAVLQHRENHALEALPVDYQEHFRSRRSPPSRRKEDDEGIEPA